MEIAGLIVALLSLLATVLGLPVLKRLQENYQRGRKKTRLLAEQIRIREAQPKFEIVLSGSNKVLRLMNTQSPAYRLSLVAYYFVEPISLKLDRTQVASQEVVGIFLGDNFEPLLNSQLMISIGFQDMDGRNYGQTFHFGDKKISLPELVSQSKHE